MKIFIKGLNTCPQRNHKITQYNAFFKGNGHDIVERLEESDAAIVWTCGFRSDVRDNSLQQLADYKSRAHGTIIATGCLPSISPDLLDEMFGGETFAWIDDEEELQRRFGTGAMTLAEAESIYTKAALCRDATQFRLDNPNIDVIFHDQFLQLMIAEGCPFRCTYCSERLAFPPFRSFVEIDLVETAIAQMRKLGQFDLMLIADCLGEYGRDTGSSLVSLVRKLIKGEPRARISFSNFHPLNFIQDLDNYTALIRDGYIYHLNLPIQSASDRILGLMARQYTQSQIKMAFGRLNQLGFTNFDTHVIVGFPGETEQDFKETLEFLLDHHPRHVLLSQFMGCDDAAAAHLPDHISPEVMGRRSAVAEGRLRDAGILCNSEGSEIIQERLRRLNRPQSARAVL